MRKVFLLLFVAVQAVSAQVPKVGSAFHTEIACWNTEWFGSTQFGPTDETLQFNNVVGVVQAADIDIWGLEEVSNVTTFQNMMNQLPQYGYVLAGFSQTQKTALIFKKNLFRRYSSGLILSQHADVFASGRLPLEVWLVSDSLPHADTLIVIVLHMKANTGTDADKLQSYYDRRDASVALKTYLDQNHQDKKVAVIGDWNDQLTKSIWKDSITPYRNFLDDPANYFFTTLQLNQNGESSYGSSGSFIDHIMISNRLRQQYEAGSAKVFKLNNYISNYLNTTSDHYPVYGFYNFGPGTGIHDADETKASLQVYPNPAGHIVNIQLQQGGSISHIQVTGTDGRMVLEQDCTGSTLQLHKAELGSGLFIIRLSTSDGKCLQCRLLMQ